MRKMLRGGQLALEWTHRVRWDELPVATRRELHGLLGALLRQCADAENPAKGASDE